MTVRVDVDRLPPEVVAALDRGDTVEFERSGKVTAAARPEEPPTGRRLWVAMSKLKPLDDQFEQDVQSLEKLVRRGVGGVR